MCPAIPRIVCYHQTHYDNQNSFVSILPLLGRGIRVSHVIIGAIHLNDRPTQITLNNDVYDHDRLDGVWTEARALQLAGVKVLGMLGGAAKGSFRRLDGDEASFETRYRPLRRMIEWCGFDGLDLDIEEPMSLTGVMRLVVQLWLDFGPDFVITLAPVATALQGGKNLSGFDYEMLEKAAGDKISFYNVQFYCGWGAVDSTTGYDKIIQRGWSPQKVVLGVSTNPTMANGWVGDEVLAETLARLTLKYAEFGGVMGWEYYQSVTVQDPCAKPWGWAKLVTTLLHNESKSDGVAQV